MQGIKHIIECHCMLPQYKNRPEPIFHKFIVFSVIDDSDTVVPKYSQCNNCGIVHKIIDICQSEIITGKEELKSFTTVDEIRLMLPDDVEKVLDTYDVDLPVWEHVLFTLQNAMWDSCVILTRDVMENEMQGKLMRFDSDGKIKIETFIHTNVIE